MRKNAKSLFVTIIILVLLSVDPLYSQNITNTITNTMEGNSVKERFGLPTYSSEIINEYSAEDKIVLPFVYNGFIYTFSLNRKRPLWRFFIGGDLENPFVLNGKRLFFFDIYNRLYSVNLADGKLMWIRDVNDEIIGQPFIVKNKIVIATQKGNILAFSEADGKLIMQYDTEREIAGGINFYNNLMIIAFKEGLIEAYNIYTGKKVWQFANTGFISVKPVVNKGKLFFGTWDNNFYSLDVKEGKLVWVNYVGSEVSRDFLVFKNSIVLFLSGGEILSLNKQNGVIEWVKYFKGIDFDYNYFGGIDKFYVFIPELIAYDPNNGSMVFAYRERTYKLYEDMLFDMMVEGKHFIDEKEREKLLRDKYFVVNNYPILPPVKSDDLAYYVGDDSNLYVYDIKKDFFILKYKLE
ncbi:MAG: hypothetical protein DRP84_07780 [Spirochaetes bacterium]|nr:MAG: hypothetical protein DRP84_07780 [Spirochaetota bacterium]